MVLPSPSSPELVRLDCGGSAALAVNSSSINFDNGIALASAGGPGQAFIEGSPSRKGLGMILEGPWNRPPGSPEKLDFKARAMSAAGAAFLSAIIVNPLDVVKTRLQAQAAGVPYQNEAMRYVYRPLGLEQVVYDGRCPAVCPRGGPSGGMPLCPPECFHYKGTFDVIAKIVRQEGAFRLWTGTNAALAIAVPTVGIYLPCYDVLREWIEKETILAPYSPFLAGTVARSLACIVCGPIELARTRMQAYKEMRAGVRPPGILATLVSTLSRGRRNGSDLALLKRVRILWMGVGAQLARDVPFSAICWSTLEPTRRSLIQRIGPEPNAAAILGANFGAGMVAGFIAAGATCPLDVAKTRRQIQDPSKPMSTSTRQVLMQVWREAGIRGLFMGVGPRIARAGPSVGIVVSFYEIMKHIIRQS